MERENYKFRKILSRTIIQGIALEGAGPSAPDAGHDGACPSTKKNSRG
jgi:hypothetical protein